MIDPATAKIIGWIGRVVAVVLMLGVAVMVALITDKGE